MIIDSHGHVTAPDALYVYKAGLLAHRGGHGRGSTGATDEDIRAALHKPVFGGTSHLEQLKEAGIDMQLMSPRPYQMMHSEDPKLVRWYIEETNIIISKQCQMYPNVFRGVCGLPQSPGVSPKELLPYLETCVKEMGFVGCLLNPDPGECSGHITPPLGDRFWYPLYEKLVEMDIPAHLHSAGCRSPRLTYSTHFINEETIGVVSLLNSQVFDDFPTLKILISHGGGAVPYQWARWEAGSLRGKGPRFSERLRCLYYDTVLYSKGSLELLIKTVGVDRCLFGTERPGVGTVKDPRTGRWLDQETKICIDSFDWLSAAEKKMIYEDNAKKLFKLDVGESQAKGGSAQA